MSSRTATPGSGVADLPVDPGLAPDPVLPSDPLAGAAMWAQVASDAEVLRELEESLWSVAAADQEAGQEGEDVDLGAVDNPAASWPPEGLLDSLAPGPVLAELVASVDLDACPDGQVVEVVAAAVRVQSWAAAVEHTATAALLGRARRWRGCSDPSRIVTGRTVSSERVVAQELSAALGVSSRAATNRVHLAQALAELPTVRATLRAGRIDLYVARSLTEVLAVLDMEQARQLAAKVLAGAPDRSGAQIVASARRGVLAVDPRAAEKRYEEKRAERGVSQEPLPDGMAGVSYVDSAEKVATFFLWVTGMAELARAGDPPGARRTLDQARADVLADIATHGLAAQDLPRRQGRRPQVQVVVAASTMLGLDDQPGELAGYGPIPASVARRVAADGVWRRLLADPRTGRFDELSEQTYEPSQDLRDHVIARDRTCRGPGCRLPADRCDLDHRVPHPRGPTAPGNLYAACRPFHETKTLTDTDVADDGAGGLHVRFPSGRAYHLPTDPLLGSLDEDRFDAGTDGFDVPPF